MNTFRLLGGVSIAATLLCGGTSLAIDAATPILVIDEDDIGRLPSARDISEILYLLPAVSAFSTGDFAPEIGAGIKLRGLAGPNVNVSVEGSAALLQPASVGELWIGSRLGFTLGDISDVEIVGSGALGLIGGSPAYRFGVGGEVPLLSSADLFVEGIARGNFGASPSDFGIRAGLHFYPGRIADVEQIEVLRGPQGTLFGDNRFYAGGSVTVIPSASLAIPAVDFGAQFGVANGFDIGPRVSLGYGVPGGNYEAWVGAEAGYRLTPEIRAFLFGEVGSIGGFSANRIGVGGEYQFDSSISLVGEVSGRGGIGTFSEFGVKFGGRFYLDPLDLGGTGPQVPASNGFVPYVGKSISALNTGDYIPALDFGVNFPTGNGLVPGLRGQVGYQLPAGILEGWGGAQLGFSAMNQFTPYIFGDVGSIGGFMANRIGVGGEFSLDQNWGIKAEVFGRGGLGSITEGGIKLGVHYTLNDLLGPGAF